MGDFVFQPVNPLQVIPMSNQRYNLLTASIVSAIHPNEAQSVGTKWEPSNTIDTHEADQLCELGYAVKCDSAEGDTVTLTWLQRQEAEAEAEQDEGEYEPGGDGSADDTDLLLILDGSVPQVEAELDGLDRAQLQRLAELEATAGKNRAGVQAAIQSALAGLED